MQGNAATPLLTQEAASERKPLKVQTAFLIYIEEGGRAVMTHDVGVKLELAHAAQPPDVINGCAQVDAFVRAELAASLTVQHMASMGRAMAEAQQNQQVLQTINKVR